MRNCLGPLGDHLDLEIVRIGVGLLQEAVDMCIPSPGKRCRNGARLRGEQSGSPTPRTGALPMKIACGRLRSAMVTKWSQDSPEQVGFLRISKSENPRVYAGSPDYP